MAKKRFYVVWNGLTPGIYKSWDECQEQIKGVKQALYKSFDTLEEAERAYSSSPKDYIGQGNKEKVNATPGNYPAEIIRHGCYCYDGTAWRAKGHILSVALWRTRLYHVRSAP